MGGINNNNKQKVIYLNNTEKNKSYYICQVLDEHKKNLGNGFFCKIPFPDKKNLLPVLIFKNQTTNIIDSSKDKKLILNNDKYFQKKIQINSRKYYLYEIYNIIIIEIKNEDNLKINLFLKIESDINNANKSFNNICLESYKKSYEGTIEVTNAIDSIFKPKEKYY